MARSSKTAKNTNMGNQRAQNFGTRHYSTNYRGKDRSINKHVPTTICVGGKLTFKNVKRPISEFCGIFDKSGVNHKSKVTAQTF